MAKKVAAALLLVLLVLLLGATLYLLTILVPLSSGEAPVNETETINQTERTTETNVTEPEEEEVVDNGNPLPSEFGCADGMVLSDGKCYFPNGRSCETDDQCLTGLCVEESCRYTKETYVDTMDQEDFIVRDCCPFHPGEPDVDYYVPDHLIVTSENGCACALKQIEVSGTTCDVSLQYKGDRPAFCITENEDGCKANEIIEFSYETNTWTEYKDTIELTTTTPYVFFYSEFLYSEPQRLLNRYDNLVLECS